MKDCTEPPEGIQRPWWQFWTPIESIDFNAILDRLWSGVILAEPKYNPDKSCYQLAEEYRHGGHTVEDNVRNFIQWQTGKAALVGFVLGAPGLITLAAAIPGDFVACAYLQMRAVAVIGCLCGWDVKSDQIKTAALYAMAGGGVTDSLATFGAKMATKQATIGLKALPAKILTAINQKLGYRFITKFGSQGLINLADFVPVVGGAVSGAVNAIFAYQAGCIAYGILKDGPSKDIMIDLAPDPA